MKNIEDMYVASPMQQGLIFHSLYAPSSADYIVQIVCEIEGELEPSILARAWQHLINRYSILRTFFVWEEVEEVLQVVCREIELPSREMDWRGLTKSEQQAQLQALIDEDRAQGFDLLQAPLMRLTVIRLDARLYTLIWSHHHVLLDGWSTFLIFRQSFELYEAYIKGNDLRLEPSQPYRDYIAWLQQQDMNAAEQFWREKLKGYSNSRPLTGERRLRKDGHDQSVVSEQQRDWPRLYLSVEMTAALKQLARQQQLTLNTLVMGAWALVLSRYTGEPDVLFGTVVAGRPASLRGVETMVGPFINLLPLRLKIERHSSLLSWLKAVQAEHAEVRSYDYSPLVQVQAWSDTPRGTPLFETMMDFENYPVDASSFERDVSLRITQAKTLTKTNYPLSFEVTPFLQNLMLQLSYDSAYFDRESVERMLGHAGQVLAEMVANPEARIGEVSLLTDAERDQILVEWNETAVTYDSSPSCAHQLFEAQVLRSPDAPAVCYAHEQLTYDELNRRANQLAHYLRRLGVRTESRVGLYVERSLRMVVGLLAVLKAGAAYVPLDPGYPVQRLKYMIEDAGVDVLLSERGLDEQLHEGVRQVVLMDEQWEEIGQESEREVKSEVGAANLAYIIYTSGSTGQPKGVMITHHGLVNFLHTMSQRPSLSPDDLLLSVTTLCFDIAALELLLPLTLGARLLIASRDEAADPARLLHLLRSRQVTVMQATPATWRMLVASGWSGPEPRKALCGGEALSLELGRQLSERSHEVWNLYGPTETTIWSSVEQVRGERGRQSIGQPIANTQLYVLDEEQELVAVGVSGELYIGGAGVARGYMGQPALTAQKFIPDPFGAHCGARLYRTGDIARRLADGQLEYLGRRDEQVKLRGYRIEPGEIEAALRRHELVRESVVLLRQEEGAEAQLVAYLVYEQGVAEVSSSQLRAHLQESVPQYMIPGKYVSVPELPLTKNGKVDRKALQQVEVGSWQREHEYVEARNATEEALVEVWQEVLSTERVGVHDNFFEVGGDSILSIRIITRANSRGVRLTPRDIFMNPTIASLAKMIAAARTETGEEPLISVAPAEIVSEHKEEKVKDSYPLSPMQEVMLAQSLLSPSSGVYIPQLVIGLGGEINLTIFEQAWARIVERHTILRTSFVLDGLEDPLQVVNERASLALEYYDWRSYSSHEQQSRSRRLINENLKRGFDLTRPPLMRLTVIRMEESYYRFIWSCHHLLLDGWSCTLIFNEFLALYKSFVEGEDLQLEPARPYRGYIDWVQRQDMAEAEMFWRQTLRGFTRPTQLLIERADGDGFHSDEEQERAYGDLRLALPEETTTRLRERAREHRLTLNTMVQGAWSLLLARYSRAEEVMFGTIVSGRPHELAGVEEIPGLFINALPTRVRVRQESNLLAWLQELQATQVEMRGYEHSRLADVQRWSDLPGNAPLFESIIRFQNFPGNPASQASDKGQTETDIRHVDWWHYPLCLVVVPGRQMLLHVSYARCRFESCAVSELLESLRELLESMSVDVSHQALEQLLLTKAGK